MSVYIYMYVYTHTHAEDNMIPLTEITIFRPYQLYWIWFLLLFFSFASVTYKESSVS